MGEDDPGFAAPPPPPPVPPPQPPGDWGYDVAKARRYQAAAFRGALGDIVSDVLRLLLWLPFSRIVAGWGDAALGGRLGGLLVLAAALLASRPLINASRIHRRYALEKQYALSTQRWGGWLLDQLKAFLLGSAIAVAAVSGFYLAIWTFPDCWVPVVLAGWLALRLLIGVVFPILVVPFFVRLTPLDRPDLAERLGRLAGAAGFRVSGLYRAGFAAKTRKANAFLLGLGPTRRIVLSDTLLDRCAPEEIESVVAHELGHHVRQHLAKRILVDLVLVWLALLVLASYGPDVLRFLGFDGVHDPAALPALQLGAILASLLAAPVLNGISRAFETESDRYAIETTRNAGAFIRLMETLAAQNLADPTPHPLLELWFHGHPSLAKRIARARSSGCAGPPPGPGGPPSTGPSS